MSAKKILVIKHGALGDLFIAMGAFKAIREFHAQDHITLMTTSRYEALAKDTGFFDDIILDNRPKFYQLGQMFKLRSLLQSQNFDRVYDLQNSPRTNWYFKMLKRGQKPEWNGIAPGCSHPQTLPNRRKVHAFPRFQDQLKVAGISTVDWPDLSWARADLQKFNLKKPYVLLVPGSSPNRRIKRWPGLFYGELAQWLLREGVTPVVLGGTDDQDAIEALQSICFDAIILAGKTSYYEIIELARSANAVVGNDTGPLHIASIAKCPTVVLWSEASCPNVFAPQGDHVTIEYERYLKDLSVERVKNALRSHLKKVW